jgi:hypothetical protein
MNAHRRIAHGFKGLDTDLLRQFITMRTLLLTKTDSVLFTRSRAAKVGIL